MNGWAGALAVLLTVTNAPGVSQAVAWPDRTDPKWRMRALVTVDATIVAIAVLVLVTGPLLELLDLSAPTFRLGASVVVGVTGARWLISPTAPIRDPESSRDQSATLATLVAAPGPVLGAMAAGADAGLVAGIVSLVLAGALVAALLVLPRSDGPVSQALTRLLGAAAIVAAVAWGIDSVRTV